MQTIAEVTQKEMIVGFPCEKYGSRTTGCIVYNKHILSDENVFIKLKKEEGCSCSLNLNKEEFKHYTGAKS